MREGVYGLTFGDRTVGKVEVTRQGLYYGFSCRCRLSGEVVCRVVADFGDRQESLGVLTPEVDSFCLNTRLPVKRFPDREPQFRGMPNRTAMEGHFVPIRPEEPFSYLERLKEAYLVRREGMLYARIPAQGAEGKS